MTHRGGAWYETNPSAKRGATVARFCSRCLSGEHHHGPTGCCQPVAPEPHDHPCQCGARRMIYDRPAQKRKYGSGWYPGRPVHSEDGGDL